MCARRCRFHPSVRPWSFGLFVLLTMVLDFSSSTVAREMADWMSAVRHAFFSCKGTVATLFLSGQVVTAGLADRWAPRAAALSQCCAQVDAGIKGVSPGVETEDFLVNLQSLMRLWGGLAVAGLAVAAHLFDAACTQHLGFNLNSIMLVMITGYVTTALRQVRGPVAGGALRGMPQCDTC